jgi:hypothetical protein
MDDVEALWAIQAEVGPSLPHTLRCSSTVPGWHPMCGPHFLCDCGAVEDEARARDAVDA